MFFPTKDDNKIEEKQDYYEMKRRYVLGMAIDSSKRLAKLRRRCKSVRDLFLTGYLQELNQEAADTFRNNLIAECNEKCGVNCERNISDGKCSRNDPASSPD
jgi:hypothetical protein